MLSGAVKFTLEVRTTSPMTSTGYPNRSSSCDKGGAYHLQDVPDAGLNVPTSSHEALFPTAPAFPPTCRAMAMVAPRTVFPSSTGRVVMVGLPTRSSFTTGRAVYYPNAC